MLQRGEGEAGVCAGVLEGSAQPPVSGAWLGEEKAAQDVAAWRGVTEALGSGGERCR